MEDLDDFLGFALGRDPRNIAVHDEDGVRFSDRVFIAESQPEPGRMRGGETHIATTRIKHP